MDNESTFATQAAELYTNIQKTGILCCLACTSKEIKNVTIDKAFIGVTQKCTVCGNICHFNTLHTPGKNLRKHIHTT